MKCKEFHNDLFDYLDGKLSAEARQVMENHARECQSCAAILGRFNAVNQAISMEKALEPNPFSHTRIIQKLEVLKTHQPSPGLILLKPVLLSLGLISAMTAGFLIGNSGSLRKSQSDLESLHIEQLRTGFFIQDFADEDIPFIDND